MEFLEEVFGETFQHLSLNKKDKYRFKEIA
jgi:hypothetical protein